MKRILSFLSLLLILCLVAGCAEPEPPDYNTVMQPLDLSAAAGTKVTARMVADNTYLDDYVPEELLASTPEEVGYVMDITTKETSQIYTGANIKGDYYIIEFVRCSDGAVLGKKTFSPIFPDKVYSIDFRAKPNEESVMTWIRHLYPEWEEGQGPEHEWIEGDCVTDTVCKVCSMTIPAQGHQWLAGDCRTQSFCSVCNTARWKIPDHKVEEWKFSEQSVARTQMEGICTVCGNHCLTDTDWDILGDQLIPGHWDSDTWLSDQNGFKDHSDRLSLEINKDGTAVMNWEGKLYAFQWKYDRYIPPEKANANRWINYLFRLEGSDEWVSVRAMAKDLKLPMGEYTLYFTRPYPPFE